MRAAHLNSGVWGKVARDHALVDQKGKCRYCKGRLPRHAATRDHRIPRSKNGSDLRHNIVAACMPCNTAKGSIEERLFMRMLRGQVPCASFGVKVRATVRRLNRRADQAESRILRFAGVA